MNMGRIGNSLMREKSTKLVAEEAISGKKREEGHELPK